MIKALLSNMSPIHAMLTLWTKGTRVGEDYLGNVYYTGKARKGYSRQRRWVKYKDTIEASNVPPEWHGWLHHQQDTPPSEMDETYRKPWMKKHQPNMTGTDLAYKPPGHVSKGGKRDKAVGDYEAWKP